MARYTKVVLTVIAACLVWLVVASVAPSGKGTAAEGDAPKAIRAQVIELYDNDGHTHMRLSALEGWPTLEILDPDKMVRGRLALDEAQVSLKLYGREKGDVLSMHLTKGGGPTLSMKDNDSGAADMFVEEAGTAVFRLVDKAGKTVWRQPPGKEIFRSDPQK